ncbi:unnamed protein product, partial [Symbiodinium necroappetens]
VYPRAVADSPVHSECAASSNEMIKPPEKTDMDNNIKAIMDMSPHIDGNQKGKDVDNDIADKDHNQKDKDVDKDVADKNHSGNHNRKDKDVEDKDADPKGNAKDTTNEHKAEDVESEDSDSSSSSSSGESDRPLPVVDTSNWNSDWHDTWEHALTLSSQVDSAHKRRVLNSMLRTIAHCHTKWNEECMLQKQYDELPPPFGLKVIVSMPYKLQIAIMRVNDIAYGTLKMIDFTPNFRAGPLAIQLMLKQTSHWFAHFTQVTPKLLKESKPKQDPDDLQSGFAYIKAKECLPCHPSGIVYVKTMNDFYLTLHDLAAWFLDDVVVELLGDLKSKTIVLPGLAEKGKTPAAQAIAMAISEYYILRDKKDDSIRPGSRICSSLDQLRGESGEKCRPDILDDPDVNTVPIPKLKSFLDSSLAECHTVERWTAARSVQNQLRMLCDNKVDEKAEPPEDSDTSREIDTFYDMIKPAFHEKAKLQDVMACLKRAHFVVNMNRATFIRKAGTSKDPVIRVPHMDGVRDFLSEERKSVIGYMQDGHKTPPKDWVQKLQWSHDVMTLIIESQKKPPRTRAIVSSDSFANGSKMLKEIKLSLPFFGHVCPAFIAEERGAFSVQYDYQLLLSRDEDGDRDGDKDEKEAAEDKVRSPEVLSNVTAKQFEKEVLAEWKGEQRWIRFFNLVVEQLREQEIAADVKEPPEDVAKVWVLVL